MSDKPTNREQSTLICAAWVAPMDRPIIREGAILFHGDRIAAVGKVSELRGKSSGAQIIDLPQSIVMPGLVNAHAHLELSDCKCAAPPPGGFVQWIQELMKQTYADESHLPEIVTRAVDEGVSQCLAFGITTVGDISKQCHLTRPLLRSSPLRIISYGEVQAMAQRRHLLETRLSVATSARDAAERLRIGVSPHAPYSIEPIGYRTCIEESIAHDLPMATHLAETPFEADFLNSHTGPFRDLWTWINRWDDSVPKFPGSPIQYAASLGLLDHPTLLAHVNYCGDDDLNLLRCGKASVVYCPRTHRFFQHPPHRWREMLGAGINVAIGTDSCASSPDLNLVDDLRLLRKIARDIPLDELWQMATLRAAQAVRMQDSVGSLTAGKFADAIAFAIDGDNPLEEVLAKNLGPTHVWIGARLVAPHRSALAK